ncbi:hypothetical protein DC74_6879 [Streptomyces noursei]|nr:hypothetical protein DC74_6879 [Streptomyces noursei]
MSGRTRPDARRGGRPARPAARLLPHLRTRRPTGAQLVARHLPHRLRRGGQRRPRPGPPHPAGAGPRPRRPRPQPLAPPAAGARRPALRRHGGVLRPPRTGRPRDDVRHRLGPGLRGRRARGARTAGAGPTVGAGAPAGRRAGRRVRQLPARRGTADRIPHHPPGHLGAARPGPHLRPVRGPRPARRLGPLRAGRTGDVRPTPGRPLARAGGPDVPGVDPHRPAAAGDAGGPRLPRHHALPAGPAARPPGAAHDRRAARPGRVDRAAGRHGRPVRRPGSRRVRLPHGQAPRGDGGLASGAGEPAVAGRRPGRTDRPRTAHRRGGLFRRRAGGAARLGAAPAIRAAVAEFTERYVARGRCPADDQLDALPAAAEGRLVRGKDSP